MRGYPPPFALATDEYAQLCLAVREVFGDAAPIRLRCCTYLSFSSLARPMFDLEVEGVPLGWTGAPLRPRIRACRIGCRISPTVEAARDANA